jgi:hypothetical protein
MTTFLKDVFRTFRENLLPYFVICLIIYGIFAAGAISTYYHPDAQATARNTIEVGDEMLRNALNRDVSSLTLIIFAHNLRACIFDLLMPSLIIPIYGIVSFAKVDYFHGLVYGMPTTTNFLKFGVVLFEDQGYIFAFLAAYVYGTRFLLPKLYGIANYKQGFITGLKGFGKISLFIPIILAFSAVYESWTMAQFMPQNPFPSISDGEFQSALIRPHASFEFHGMRVAYDSTKVELSDAKIAGLAFRDIGYLGPIEVSRDSLAYRIRIAVPQQCWADSAIARRLRFATTRLQKPFSGRRYEVAACSRDSLGHWKENVLIQQ